jgi:hypothetical protein
MHSRARARVKSCRLRQLFAVRNETAICILSRLWPMCVYVYCYGEKMIYIVDGPYMQLVDRMNNNE